MAGGRKASGARLAKLGLRAAGVAHDLAQPLTVALLAARQIEGKGAGPLRQALHRMEDLLQSIRDEVSADGAKPARRLDLAAVRRQLLTGLTPTEKRRVRIRLSGVAKADAHAIQRILGNLVLNALRHGKGPVRVSGSAPGGRLAVSVEGGPGRTPDEPGWGIGLASCQDLAGRHGLTLRVEISPGGSIASLRSQG